MRPTRVREIPEALAWLQAKQPRSSDVQQAAWKAFTAVGLPHQGDEDYGFVSVAELRSKLSETKTSASAFPAPGISDSQSQWDRFDPNSDSACVSLAGQENDAAAALALAFADATGLQLAAGSRRENPLRIDLDSGPGRSDVAMFLRLEANSAAHIHLCSRSAAQSFHNAVLVFLLGPGAELDLVCEDGGQGLQAQKLRLVLAREARVRVTSASTGGALHRLALQADLREPGASLTVGAAAVVGGNRRLHRHLHIRHQSPDCVSKQLFKTVATDAARASVDGTVVVDRGAQRTDARQLIRNLLLSPAARVDAKPRLLIHADDVKCSHGAATGKFDPEQQFYLRARGLDAPAANRLLTRAFLSEALDAAPAGRDALLAGLLDALGRKTP